jgi:hypothetical protein
VVVDIGRGLLDRDEKYVSSVAEADERDSGGACELPAQLSGSLAKV